MERKRLSLIIGGYALAACAYIVFSDLVVFWLWPQADQHLFFGIAKGIVFVLLTAVVLFALLRRLGRTTRRASAAETASRTLINLVPTFFTSIPAVVYVLELRGEKHVPVWISDNVGEILGYSTTEVLSPHWWANHVHPDDYTAASSTFEDIVQKGSGNHEYRFRRADGSYMWVHDEIKIVPSKKAGMKHIVGAWSDVSERHAAKQRTEEYARQLEKAMLDTVNAISAMVEHRDPYTAGHQRRVGEIAAAIAAELNHSEDYQRGLRVAGTLHDVGKVGVSTDILTKPARLTDGEYELVKRHSESGYQILKGIDFPWPVAKTVRQHHERMDGSGYPLGLRGEEILLQARIIAVADVVESMATHRPYRDALGIDTALDEIESNAGRLYDTEVAEACLRLFRDKKYAIPD